MKVDEDHEGTAGPDIIPLARAVLCEDCRCITAAQHGACLSCGSRSTISLAKILGSDGGSMIRKQAAETPTEREGNTA